MFWQLEARRGVGGCGGRLQYGHVAPEAGWHIPVEATVRSLAARLGPCSPALVLQCIGKPSGLWGATGRCEAEGNVGDEPGAVG